MTFQRPFRAVVEASSCRPCSK